MIKSEHEDRVLSSLGQSFHVTVNKKKCLKDGFKKGDIVKVTISKIVDGNVCPYCHHKTVE